MKGFCRINGLDAFETYGMVFERGTYNALFSLPVPKERYAYDWGDSNGLDVDESEPIVLQARQLSPPMVIIGNGKADMLAKYNAYRTLLLSNVYVDYDFPIADITLKLRYTGGGNVTTIGHVMGTGKAGMRFTLNFSDDFPRILPIIPASLFDEMIFDDIILG